MADNRSYSQKKRDKMNYRYEYFKHNPGLFGCIWSCAYCHRPIIGKKNVQVDHIMPLNNVLGRNAGYNLVAACPACNRRKSDKVDGRVIEGYVSKINEDIIALLPGILKVPYALISWVVLFIGSCIANTFGFFIGKTSAVIKIAVVAAVIVAIMYYRLQV